MKSSKTSIRLLSTLSRLDAPLQRAVFLRRPHRFAIDVGFFDEDGELAFEATAHTADPGRLKHLLIPNKTTICLDGPFLNRKTSYSAILALSETNTWVSLVTTLPHNYIPLLVQEQYISFFRSQEKVSTVRREVVHENSRFDFWFEMETKGFFVECKSVTWCMDGVGFFPDAPSKRAAKHVEHAIALRQKGVEVGFLFVAQRSDIHSIRPSYEIDQRLGNLLCEAREQGVLLRGCAIHYTPEGAWFCRELPVVLDKS